MTWMRYYQRPAFVVACVCLCVCPSVIKVLHAITHHPFKIRSPNLEQRCKTPSLRFLYSWRDRPWSPKSNLPLKPKYTPFWDCPHHNSSPIEAWITKFAPEVQQTSVDIPIVAMRLTVTCKVKFKVQNFRFHHYRKYITIREPWVPRLVHGHQCFMVSILCVYLYI